MRKRGSALCTACLLFWLSDPGGAYWVNGQRWPAGTQVAMHLQQGAPGRPLIDGSTSWNTVTESALASWSAALAGVSFRVVHDSTGSIALRNRINNVSWGEDVYGEPFGDAVAVTRWMYRVSDRAMLEADVIFDSSRNWNAYRGNLRGASGGGRLYDLHRVALHEFGHVLGLGHPDDHGQSVAAVMNSRVSHLDSLQPDDLNGVRAVYGAAAAPADRLSPGGHLLPGQSVVAAGGRYRLTYQHDGNLVLYDDETRAALWASHTSAFGAGRAQMQDDGNFVVYDAQGRDRWATATTGHPNAYLQVQSDGNLVLYGADRQPLWDRFR